MEGAGNFKKGGSEGEGEGTPTKTVNPAQDGAGANGPEVKGHPGAGTCDNPQTGDSTETGSGKDGVTPPGDSDSKKKWKGEDFSKLVALPPVPGGRFVLTLGNENDDGDDSKSSSGWVWDEEGRKFVQYEIPVENLPLYKCSYCFESFRGSNALSKHLKSHKLEPPTTLRPYSSLLDMFGVPVPTSSNWSSGTTQSVWSSGTTQSVSSDTGYDDEEFTDSSSESDDDAGKLTKVRANPAPRPKFRGWGVPRKTSTWNILFRKKWIPSKPASASSGNSELPAVPKCLMDDPEIDVHIEFPQANEGGERKYKCKLCGKKFSFRQNASWHVKEDHLTEKPEQSPK